MTVRFARRTSPVVRSLRPLAPAFLAALFVPAAVVAQPSIVPVQGLLTDDLGNVVDGDLPAEFRLYTQAVGGTPLHVEILDCLGGPETCLIVRDGRFLVPLGQNNPLDLDWFAEHPEMFLGVSIAGEVELLPRSLVATTAYAGYAWRAGGVDWANVENVPSSVTSPPPTYGATAPLALDASNTFSLANVGCSPGDGWVWSGTTWTCEPASGLPYTGGAGIGVDPLTRTISQQAATCAPGQYSWWNGTTWLCADDLSGIASLVAGPGISVLGSTIAIAAPTCGAGEFSRWNGSQWQCAAPASEVPYTALPGSGITINAGTRQVAISSAGCSAGQVLRYNGTQWVCGADQTGITTITAGSGIGVAGSTVSVAAPTCAAGQYLTWNGSAFSCVADVSATYAGGDGITVTGTTIATDAVTCAAGQYSYWDGSAWLCRNDISGIASLTAGAGIATSGSTISILGTPCNPATQYSVFVGGSEGWRCVNVTSGPTYTAGAGLRFNTPTAPNELRINAANCPAGSVNRWNDATGAWVCSVDQGVRTITGNNGLSATINTTTWAATLNLVPTYGPCPAGSFTRFDNGTWHCESPAAEQAYTGGAGINVNAATRVISLASPPPASACTAAQRVTWNGTSWQCATDQQGVTAVAATAPLASTGGTAPTISLNPCATANHALIWSGAAWQCLPTVSAAANSGLTVSGQAVTMRTNCAVGQVLSWSGAASGWVCTTPASGGVASVTSAAVSAGLQPVQVTGTATNPEVGLAACGNNQVLQWTTSTGWRCIGAVAAGNGISVSGARTVTINSPACGASQASQWTGTAWTCVDIPVAPTTACANLATSGAWIGGGGAANCAPAGASQRIAHGTVTAGGQIVSGTGFRVRSRTSPRQFEVQFPTAFASKPSVTVTPISAQNTTNLTYTDTWLASQNLGYVIPPNLYGINNDRFAVEFGIVDSWGFFGWGSFAFSFIAIGQN